MNNEYRIEFGRKIAAARKAKKLSRALIGQMLGLHETTVKRYEDGDIKKVDVERMKEFAAVLGLDSKDLVGIELEEPIALSENEQMLVSTFKRLNEENQQDTLKYADEKLRTQALAEIESNFPSEVNEFLIGYLYSREEK